MPANPVKATVAVAGATAAVVATLNVATATATPDATRRPLTVAVTSTTAVARGSGEVVAKAAAGRRYSNQLSERMNVVRRRHDLRPIRVVDCLDGFAGPWARRLARTGEFYHQDLNPIMRRCRLTSAGEIIAKGAVSPRQMIKMWLDSPGHRELLLEPSFRIAGVAGRRGHGAWVGCIDFGRR
jgi:uncharacterized protein YkwD